MIYTKLLRVIQYFVQLVLLMEIVKGINIKDDKYITETLVTHKRSNMCKFVIREDTIKT